jgi:hypothetical protein
MNRLGTLKSVEAWERAGGSPSPFGATWVEPEKAWNFVFVSRYVTGATLLLYGIILALILTGFLKETDSAVRGSSS